MVFFCLNVTGQPFNAQKLMNNAVSNIICCLVFGNRFEYTDHQYQCILQHFNETVYLEGTVWAQVSLVSHNTHSGIQYYCSNQGYSKPIM